MFIESSLMTHTSTSCIVMLGAAGVKAKVFVIVWAVMCGWFSPRKAQVAGPDAARGQRFLLITRPAGFLIDPALKC